ncbi:MAG: hypothetical protein ACRDTC_20250 [Pseudonocardiaceae bacterium]
MVAPRNGDFDLVARALARAVASEAVTWAVGARIGDAAVPALFRLRGALWFGSSAAVAGLWAGGGQMLFMLARRPW